MAETIKPILSQLMFSIRALAMRLSLLLPLQISLCCPQAAFAQDAQTTTPMHCVDADFKGNAFSEDGEKTCLLELSTQFKRAGNALTINLENGRKKIYQDNPKACANDDANKCISYRLVGYESRIKYFVVVTRYYEGFGAELVNGRNGKVTSLQRLPYFSPDQSTFIVIDDDVESIIKCSITIGYVTQDAVQTECIYWPDEENWSLIKWIDNDHLSLEASFEIDGTLQTQDAILARMGHSEWIWNRSVAKPAAKD